MNMLKTIHFLSTFAPTYELFLLSIFLIRSEIQSTWVLEEYNELSTFQLSAESLSSGVKAWTFLLHMHFFSKPTKLYSLYLSPNYSLAHPG
jgi:hypothetical protein